MLINESLKAQYDVIAKKVNGQVIVIHESTPNSLTPSFNSTLEFYETTQKLGLKGIVLESING
jgi:hypothetical protein